MERAAAGESPAQVKHMTKRELAELMLTARRSAKRMGAEFTLRDDRLKAMGFTELDIDTVEWAVKEIERVTEAQLASL